ncbi:DUF6714 family protein [Deinococcus yavapaiensis]|uniref:Uncharacterized protein n=1 Tax=Deinococcus yavapaiensis KR-236 TaxID=694435 RepID=A0A318S9E1_9DEIO|nr:DUF6714 family protein [Deinococcus yavapaiensis]PYE54838.1 hypothetical protein DES52_104109 [Deinococcus yavapaiensis KR-236]
MTDVTRQHLLASIRRAFDDVTLGDGVTLSEARVIDRYGDEAARRAAREQDWQGPWWDLPAQDIDFYSPFSFLDEVGFAYYLPAYLTRSLRHEPMLACSAFEAVMHALSPDPWYDLKARRFERLTDSQASAVLAFVEFAEAHDDDADCWANLYTDVWAYWAERARQPSP